jgi:hypothetical protein
MKFCMAEQDRKNQNHAAEWEIGFLSRGSYECRRRMSILGCGIIGIVLQQGIVAIAGCQYTLRGKEHFLLSKDTN